MHTHMYLDRQRQKTLSFAHVWQASALKSMQSLLFILRLFPRQNIFCKHLLTFNATNNPHDHNCDSGAGCGGIAVQLYGFKAALSRASESLGGSSAYIYVGIYT